jgi:hypothetical protein
MACTLIGVALMCTRLLFEARPLRFGDRRPCLSIGNNCI